MGLQPAARSLYNPASGHICELRMHYKNYTII